MRRTLLLAVSGVMTLGIATGVLMSPHHDSSVSSTLSAGDAPFPVNPAGLPYLVDPEAPQPSFLKPEPTETEVPSIPATSTRETPPEAQKPIQALTPRIGKAAVVEEKTGGTVKPTEETPSVITPVEKPTWTQADQDAADASCVASFGPGAQAMNTPAVGDPKPAGLKYPCRRPESQ